MKNPSITFSPFKRLKPKLEIALLVLVGAMFMAACSSDDGDGSSDPKDQSYRRSVIVYMAAQNSLGRAGAARLDSAEIVNGMSLTSNTQDNVFMFVDDARKPRLYRIYRMGSGANMRTMVSLIKTWATDVYSSDPETLREVLDYVHTNYKSTSYGLVMWSHGSGWLESDNVINTMKSNLYSFGVDVGEGGDMTSDQDADGKTGSQMNVMDMAKAIAASGIHPDYIFFDACLMQCIEVAYELRNVTDYIVASASSTSAYGGYYTNLLPNGLLAYPTTDESVLKIADCYYYDAVENTSLHKYYGNTGDVIATIKTSALGEFAAQTSIYINKVVQNRESLNLNGVQAYCSSSMFDSPAFYDMGSVMGKTLSADDYNAWRAEADKCILEFKASDNYLISSDYYGKVSDRDHMVGVSMFVPSSKFELSWRYNYNVDFQKTSWYSAAGWETTGW